ncbi:MAG TPA: thiamine pyrophosphate-dependent enzyme, partial [Chitinophagales bacterium]|nr:thiamine pyrophosphate-dependent enzyme [Chitinophagales bacterium]
MGAGIGFAEKYKGTGNVCICYFGDGAVRQGSLHETFNMAMLWKIPVVFICENNGYAMGTSLERTTNQMDMYKIGLAYDMPSYPVDGMQPETVHAAVYEAVEKARNNEGPTFLEIRTYRYRGHSMSDPAKYRTKEEVEEYKMRDPLETTMQKILDKKYATMKEIEDIQERIEVEIEACVKFAEESPYPDDDAVFEDIYVQQDYPFIKD